MAIVPSLLPDHNLGIVHQLPAKYVCQPVLIVGIFCRKLNKFFLARGTSAQRLFAFGRWV